MTPHKNVIPSFISIADTSFFNPKPIQEYSEHKADILDFSWSTKVT